MNNATLTPSNTFADILRANGFQRGSQSQLEYERGKRVITRLASTSKQYETMIMALADYLKI